MRTFVFLCLLCLALLPTVILGKETDVVGTRDGKGMARRRRKKGNSRASFEGDDEPVEPSVRRRRRSDTAKRRRRRRRRSGSAPAPRPSPPAPEPTSCRCPGGSSNRKVCFMWGDPHFAPFDGTSPGTSLSLVAERTTTQHNRYWAVKSSRVKIQGLAYTKRSYFAGVAITGSFLQNHVLVAYSAQLDGKPVVSWDGKQILKSGERCPEILKSEDGNKNMGCIIKPMRGVELTRSQGFHKIKHSAFDVSRVFDVKKKKAILANARLKTETVFHFKLPGNVEVLTTLTWPRTLALIKMPRQKGQDGWCGNFDGKPEFAPDETFVSNAPDTPETLKKKNDFTVAPRDDLFRKAGLGRPQLVQVESESAAEGTQNATSGYHGCDTPEQLEKAKSACAHLLLVQIYEACIMDVCETGETEAAVQNAEETSIIMAFGRKGKEGKGKGSGSTRAAVSEEDDGCVCD